MSTSRRMLLINNDDDMKNILIDLDKFTKSNSDSNYNYYNAANTLAGFQNCGIFTSNAQLLEWLNEYMSGTGPLDYRIFVHYSTSNIYGDPTYNINYTKLVYATTAHEYTSGGPQEGQFNMTYTKYIRFNFHDEYAGAYGNHAWIDFFINGSTFVGMTLRN